MRKRSNTNTLDRFIRINLVTRNSATMRREADLLLNASEIHSCGTAFHSSPACLYFVAVSKKRAHHQLRAKQAAAIVKSRGLSSCIYSRRPAFDITTNRGQSVKNSSGDCIISYGDGSWLAYDVSCDLPCVCLFLIFSFPRVTPADGMPIR